MKVGEEKGNEIIPGITCECCLDCDVTQMSLDSY